MQRDLGTYFETTRQPPAFPALKVSCNTQSTMATHTHKLHDLAFMRSLAETGMIPGIILQLVFAGGAIWTLYLLVTLYFELKKRSLMNGTWYGPDGKTRKTLTQYHELVYGLWGKWPGHFTTVIVVITSIGEAQTSPAGSTALLS